MDFFKKAWMIQILFDFAMKILLFLRKTLSFFSVLLYNRSVLLYPQPKDRGAS